MFRFGAVPRFAIATCNCPASTARDGPTVCNRSSRAFPRGHSGLDRTSPDFLHLQTVRQQASGSCASPGRSRRADESLDFGRQPRGCRARPTEAEPPGRSGDTSRPGAEGSPSWSSLGLLPLYLRDRPHKASDRSARTTSTASRSMPAGRPTGGAKILPDVRRDPAMRRAHGSSRPGDLVMRERRDVRGESRRPRITAWCQWDSMAARTWSRQFRVQFWSGFYENTWAGYGQTASSRRRS